MMVELNTKAAMTVMVAEVTLVEGDMTEAG